MPLAFAPFHLFPLAFIAPAVLFLLLGQAAPRAAFRYGLSFGIGLFGVGASWVYVAIHDFGYTGVALAALLTALFVMALALYPALFAWGAAWLRLRWGKGLGEGLWLAGVLPLLWLAMEWVRGWFLTGFPWLQLGYSQEHGPLIGLAPVLGVQGVTLACALSAGVLAALVRLRRQAWPGALLLAIVWSAAWGLQRVDWTTPAGPPLTVALIQDNLSQVTKWEEGQLEARLELYARLTLEQLGRVEAVIWPENAVTVFYHQLEEDYFSWLAQQARAAGTDLVIGVPVLREDGIGYHTSLMVLGAQPGVYHKRHLVPFGEFMPLEGLLRGLIRFFDLPMSDFTAGPPDQPPLWVAGRRAAMSICYEDAFPTEMRHNFPAATVLINGSNNAWYGDSLAPHQHLEIARMRAVESGRPLIRATTTGISALVDHRGRLLATAPQFQTAVLEGAVQPMGGLTPYARWGEATLLLLLTVTGVFLWGWRRVTRR